MSGQRLSSLAESPLTMTEGSINFVPTFTKSQVPQGGYYIGNNANKIYEAAQARNMKGYRAFFTVNTSGVKGLNSNLDDISTVIDNVAEGNSIVAVYNMSGVKTEGLQRGINIVYYSDGTTQKVIVK